MGAAGDKSVMALSEHSPILVEKSNGKMYMGSAHELIIACCLQDARNKPKKDAKGKVDKPKKGQLPAKNLYPSDLEKKIHKLLEWYLKNLKPHSLHLSRKIVDALKYEQAYISKDSKGKIVCNAMPEIKKIIDKNAEDINIDMKHIHEALFAFEEYLKAQSGSGSQVYAVSGEHMTMIDIILYIEINQILFMHNKYHRNSGSDLIQKQRDEMPDAQLNQELYNYLTVKKWYDKSMQKQNKYHETIVEHEAIFKTEVDRKILSSTIQ